MWPAKMVQKYKMGHTLASISSKAGPKRQNSGKVQH